MTTKLEGVFYVTKYALSSGIEVVSATVDEMFSDMLTWRNADGYLMHAHGDDWHRTRDAAMLRAEAMREAKIASLKKQIAKLDRLSFAAHQNPQPDPTINQTEGINPPPLSGSKKQQIKRDLGELK